MKRVFGFILLSLPFIAVFIFLVARDGIIAVIEAIITTVIVGCVVVGVNLIT